MADIVEVSNWQVHLEPGQQFDPSELLADGSLARSWVKSLSSDSDRELFCDGEGEWISRGEFLKLTENAAFNLYSRGLRAGDRVILSANPSVNMVAYYVAALRLSLAVVPVNTSFTEAELGYIVNSVLPSAAIIDSEKRASWVEMAWSEMESGSGFVGPGSNLPLPTCGLAMFDPRDRIMNSGESKEIELDASSTETVALIAFTSGTTGRPKGAILTHGNLLACAKSLNLAWRWTSKDRLILGLPLFHIHGLGVGINGTLCAGSSAILLPKFEPALVDNSIEGASPSMFFGVPTMYQKLLDAKVAAKLARLRLVVSGSAPMSRELHRAIRQVSGVEVLERYGTTETLIDISNPYDGQRIPGTVGMPLPGVRVAISKSTDEIFIKGPTVFSGYLANAKATENAFPLSDGWFSTGDLGSVDDRGYISIFGRSKDLIISGGFNVYPREVEEAFESHPLVSEVAVVGKPSEIWGEEVTAFIVGDDGLSSDELIDYVSNTLAKYKQPKSIIFVESLPRNAMGKVLYNLLRDQLE